MRGMAHVEIYLKSFSQIIYSCLIALQGRIRGAWGAEKPPLQIGKHPSPNFAS